MQRLIITGKTCQLEVYKLTMRVESTLYVNINNFINLQSLLDII